MSETQGLAGVFILESFHDRYAAQAKHCLSNNDFNRMGNKKSCENAGQFEMVASKGIEPLSEDPESSILSIELRGRTRKNTEPYT